jgi:hypothetical protein
MRRIVWMAVGAGITIYVVRRVNRTLDAASPEGIGRSLTAAVDALHDLADEVREAMAEREQELRVALGVEAGTMDPEDPSLHGRHAQPR